MGSIRTLAFATTSSSRPELNSLMLFGFGDPDSERLAADVIAAHPDMVPVRADSLRLDETAGGKSGDAIALVWCLGASPAHGRLVTNRVAAEGNPVVAITEDVDTRGFDFRANNLEVCFNPFSSDEVLARIDAAIARSTRSEQSIIQQGDLTINTDNFDVQVSGTSIELTYKEYELLKLLASNPGRVFRREDILNRIWGDDYFGGTRTVDVHVRRLRSKLDDVSHEVIETMWRVGYRFSIPGRQKQRASK